MKVKSEYIKQLIKRKSLKQIEVAEKIDVGTQDWNNWMHRSAIPLFKNIERIAEILEVPAATLLDETDTMKPMKGFKNGTGLPISETIPFYDEDTATTLNILSNKKTIADPTDYAYIPGLSAHLILPFYGKEMEPTLSNGDLVVLRKIKDMTFFNFGNLYMISTAEQILTRYIKSGKNNSSIILSSKRKDGLDFELAVKKIKSVHLVVSTIKRQVI